MSDDQAPILNAPIRAFSQLLSMIEDGKLHGDLSTEIEDLVAQMQDASAGGRDTSGKITITIDLKYDAKAQMFEILGDFKIKPPTEKRGKSVFWATPDNQLTRFNPRQQDMFLRDANNGKADPRSV
jgi:hypothetical protein